MRIGLFGGTFDPVHLGHLLLAECCREERRLDEVWFVPAAQSPLKIGRPPTPAAARVEMLTLAIGGNPAFKLCRHEIDRGGVSYTVDTLAAIREQRPGDELVFLLGSDQLHLLPRWREPTRIMELAEVVYVDRAGEAEPDWEALRAALSPERAEALRARKVTMPSVWLSSTDLRERVESGRSVRYQTPAAVERYIHEHGLYRATSDAAK